MLIHYINIGFKSLNHTETVLVKEVNYLAAWSGIWLPNPLLACSVFETMDSFSCQNRMYYFIFKEFKEQLCAGLHLSDSCHFTIVYKALF